nr:unnamed protein product [Callosobruchus analis]
MSTVKKIDALEHQIYKKITNRCSLNQRFGNLYTPGPKLLSWGDDKPRLPNNILETDRVALLDQQRGEFCATAPMRKSNYTIRPSRSSSMKLVELPLNVRNGKFLEVSDLITLPEEISHAVLDEAVDIYMIRLLDGDYTTYLSDDSVETEDDGERLNFAIEFLNSTNSSGMPQHRLRLKVGTIVMLLRHLNTKKGLCNGTKLVITNMRSNVIEALFLGSSQNV